MTRNHFVPAVPASAWQLIEEFALPDRPGGASLAAERVVGLIRGLGLPPAQVERIGNAIVETVLIALAQRDRSGTAPPVSIRVLAAGGKAAGDSQIDVEGRRAERGWGFFLVKRLAAGSERRHTIELFLYPEGADRAG